MKSIDVFVFLIVSVGAVYGEIFAEELKNFRMSFNKIYKSNDEAFQKFKNFIQNLEFIQRHNKVKGKSFKLEVNYFADMGEDDLKRREKTELR
jgi:hypothetical protein